MDLSSLRKNAQKRGIPIIKQDTERLLRLLTELKRPSKILEIGTAVGYSAGVMLSCGDGNSKLYTIEADEQRYFEAKENLKAMGFSDRAVCYAGDACEILKSLTGGYDFIFVDGPKGQYVHFLPYLLNVLNAGGLLVCDNVLYRGLVDGSVAMRRKSLTMVNNLRQFIEDIQNDACLVSTVLNVGDGVSVSYKKINL